MTAAPDGAGSDTRVPLLRAAGVSRRYGDFLANDCVDLDLWPAEIHALLGENGAGKSTLVKMIYGLIAPSAGELVWQGRPIAIAGPAAARAFGIGMVFQHFTLFENLTVAENVALGLDSAEPLGVLADRLVEVSRTYGLPLEPRREVWRLSAGERQRIEVVRALLQDPRLLILDEPTSVLTPQEVDELFRTLRKLKAEGRAVLYISHKLEEVRALCDRATILRAGKVVATCVPAQETAASLAALMVGADIKGVRAERADGFGAVRLAVDRLALAPLDPHGVRLQDVALQVRGGEILGIAGIAGNGQGELFGALSGERPSRADAIRIDGRDAGSMSITQRRRLGAAFVPEDRLGHATAPQMRLHENALITGHATGHMSRHGLIDAAAALKVVDDVTAAFDVRKAERDPAAASLSGGNLQKFVVGRDILRAPGVLVVNQPTWGVDAGAAATLRQALVDLARAGAAVLLISQDLDELFEIADRIAVIAGGRLSVPLDARSAERATIGLMMGAASTSHEGVALAGA